MNDSHATGTARASRKLVFLLQDLGYGAAPRLALELAASLDAAQWQAQLWMLSRRRADLAPLAVTRGLGTVWLGGAAGPVSLARLLAMLRSERPELLYCLGAGANVWGRLLGRLAGVSTVLGSLRCSGDVWRQCEPVLSPLARGMVVPAAALKAGLPQGVQRRCLLLPDGVDTERFAPGRAKMRDDAPHILCLGRLERHKGQALLLQAFAEVLASRPDARLMVVGDGPRRERLVRLAQKLGIDSQTQFLPARQDVAPLYHVARFVVLPSLRAGAPRVLLEAMASGLPVIGADTGGVRELLGDGEAGLLIPKGDRTPLARAMLQLLEDEELCRSLGEAGRRRVQQHYSLAACVQAYGSLFSELSDASGG